MTRATGGRPWRPYQDAPLLTALMTLGPGHADDEDEQALCEYLGALVAARRSPVHVAVAFNALFFGYDLAEGGYVGGPVDLDSFPVVTFGKTTGALPVGAMVNVAAGGQPLFAEVVYKEGAHPQLGRDGHVPSWLSGAPAGATGPNSPLAATVTPVLAERLVCDFDAFGQGIAIARDRLDRFRARGRWLDADGHLLLEARYASAEDAELDDVTFYSAYLLGPARDRLLSFAAPQPLLSMLTDTAGAEQVEQALLGLLATIRAALHATVGVRMWRSYAFTETSLAERLAADGALGGEDLRHVASVLARAPDRGRRNAAPGPQISYTAVGPRLRQLGSAEVALRGLGYPAVICHANTVIADYLAGPVPIGAIASAGHVRLDDAWQGGGVWRTEHPAGPYSGIDSLQALGLGWLESQTGQCAASDKAGPDPDSEPHRPDETQLLGITDSQLSWMAPLRLVHLLEGRCPLPEKVVEEMASSGLARPASRGLRMILRHEEVELLPDEATQDGVALDVAAGRGRLVGIAWPLEMLPGVKVTFVWQRGAVVLSASTRLMDAPVELDGVTYDHEYDPRIVTRDGAPGSAMRGRAGGGPLSLAERIVRAVRRYGWLADDGTAVIETSRLASTVYGPTAGATAQEALWPVLERLLGRGDLRAALIDRGPDGLLCYPPIPGVPGSIEIIAWVPRPTVGTSRSSLAAITPRPELSGYVSTQNVRWFLRKIDGTPGPQAQADFDEQARRHGYAPRQLPPGYTFVREHTRVRRW